MLYKEGEHMENQVRDLRSALKLLKEIPGQLVETDVEVNPKAELNIINLRKKWKGICSQVPFIVLKYRQGCI